MAKELDWSPRFSIFFWYGASTCFHTLAAPSPCWSSPRNTRPTFFPTCPPSTWWECRTRSFPVSPVCYVHRCYAVGLQVYHEMKKTSPVCFPLRDRFVDHQIRDSPQRARHSHRPRLHPHRHRLHSPSMSAIAILYCPLPIDRFVPNKTRCHNKTILTTINGLRSSGRTSDLTTIRETFYRITE